MIEITWLKIKNFIKKRIHRKKRELKRDKLHSTRRIKYEIKIIELKNNLEAILDSKDELQTKLDKKNNKSINLKEKIRDNRKYNETNHTFDFTEIPKEEDIDLNQFPNIAENVVIMWFVTKTKNF